MDQRRTTRSQPQTYRESLVLRALPVRRVGFLEQRGAARTQIGHRVAGSQEVAKLRWVRVSWARTVHAGGDGIA